MNLRRPPFCDPADFGHVTLPKGDSRSGFGTLLRTMRRSAGLSQEALADRAQLSVVTVGALERGSRRAPYRATLAKLSDALALAPQERARLETAAARPRRRRLLPGTSEPPDAVSSVGIVVEHGQRVTALQIVGVIVLLVEPPTSK